VRSGLPLRNEAVSAHPLSNRQQGMITPLHGTWRIYRAVKVVVQYFWAYFVAYYFSPYAGFAIDDEEGMGFAAGDMLDQ